MGRWSVKSSSRGLILMLVGAPFLAVGILGGLGANELERRGVPTEARLVEKYTSRVATRGAGHLHYNLRLAYLSPDGDEHEHVTEAMDASHFESLEVGDVVDLVYDPQNPSNATVPWRIERTWWLAAFMVGGLGLAVAGLESWILLRQRTAATN